jgi:hypothetical protein
MTNREAILRLSANTGDEPAMAWLRDKNSKVIRGVIARYFGAGPEADSAEGLLMQRLAENARSYEAQENADEWLVRCTNTECNRLRNEAIHHRANRD